ncbi:hypothetical protein GCM10027435_28190 [Haloparvum alkalitolerans]|uniref:hypothetical protein n=1 Tax=Haloparvum alkalitolerans TaxID=1042953 RepID=UPI003CE9C70C
MSDWNDADDLVTAVAVLVVGGPLLYLTLNIGELSFSEAWAVGEYVIRTIAVPTFGLIILFWALLKMGPLVDVFADW